MLRMNTICIHLHNERLVGLASWFPIGLLATHTPLQGQEIKEERAGVPHHRAL